MYSPCKQVDRELALEIGELIKILVKAGHTDEAEGWAELYQTLTEKIKTHDYSKEDKSILLCGN